MTTTLLDNRSELLQNAVLDYFNSYPNEARREPNQRGFSAVEFCIRGDLAERFRGVSSAIAGSQDRRLRLLFDGKYAESVGGIDGYELVSPGSEVVRIILNDLGPRSAFTRSAALLNLDGTFSDLSALGMRVDNAPVSARHQFVFRSFFLLRYRFRQSSYENTEDVIPILIDPQKNAAVEHQELARITGLNLVDLHAVNYADELPMPPTGQQKLREIIDAGDSAVKQRVEVVCRQRAAELEKERQAEVKTEQGYFEREMKGKNAAVKLGLEKQLAQDMEDLKSRYSVDSVISLLSAQEIVVPLVRYEVSIDVDNGAAGEAKHVAYDPLSGKLTGGGCESCGQNRRWICCGDAHMPHLECPACGQFRICSFRDEGTQCTTALCHKHGYQCGAESCDQRMCHEHVLHCHYCDSGATYCQTHIYQSFESQQICSSCATQCSQCDLLFPPARSAPCHICGEDFCHEHTQKCPACGNLHCEVDTGHAQGHDADYCTNCLKQCEHCDDKTLRYLKTDVQFCQDCGCTACGMHSAECASCGLVYCTNHQLETPDGVGGTCCYASCQTCDTIHHRRQLSACHLCQDSPNDMNLHCREHTEPCVLCNKTTCQSHQVAMPDGRIACENCVVACDHCGNLFDEATSKRCADANCQMTTVCATCAKPSEFRPEFYCPAHAKSFVDCLGCKARGPARQLAECTLCEVSTCPKCHRDGGGVCRHCREVAEVTDFGELQEWRNKFAGANVPIPDRESREIINALSGEDKDMRVLMSRTTSHLVVRGQYREGVWRLLRRWMRRTHDFVIVFELNGDEMRVKVIE